MKKLSCTHKQHYDHILNNVVKHLKKLEILTNMPSRGWDLVGEAEFGDRSLQVIIINCPSLLVPVNFTLIL